MIAIICPDCNKSDVFINEQSEANNYVYYKLNCGQCGREWAITLHKHQYGLREIDEK